MEQGKLNILKTKKGYATKIIYVKKSGKQGQIPVTAYQAEDMVLDGTDCFFARDGGTLIKLVAHDGTVLYDANTRIARTSDKSTSNPNRGSKRIADSYEPSKAFLPSDTMVLLEKSGITPDNFLLKWQKAARYDERKKNFQFFKREHKGNNFEIIPEFGDLAFSQIADRNLKDAEALLGKNNVQVLDLTIDWRMVQGLGGSSVYETSMSLHHVYGIPFISSSSLKGVVRSHLISNKFSLNVPENVVEKDRGRYAEKLAWEDRTFVQWFGNVGQKGKLMFFEALPLESPTLEVDIMNPHYSDYYSDTNMQIPPADYFNPIPIPFLTVCNTSFRIIVGTSDQLIMNEKIDGKSITQWLQSALTHHGIGAKTAVGYGYFKTAQ